MQDADDSYKSDFGKMVVTKAWLQWFKVGREDRRKGLTSYKVQKEVRFPAMAEWRDLRPNTYKKDYIIKTISELWIIQMQQQVEKHLFMKSC